MLGGHPGLNSTHVRPFRPYSLNLEGAVAALSYVPIISPFSLRMYGCFILTEYSRIFNSLPLEVKRSATVFKVGLMCVIRISHTDIGDVNPNARSELIGNLAD